MEEKVKPYSTYEVSKLMGYCQETDPAQLPEIWKLFKTTKEVDDHRMNLHREMAEFASKEGIGIDRSIFFAKELIEDIVKMRFDPVGITGTLASCEKGIFNMLCLPRTSGEIEALRLFEQAVDEMQGTRTLKEAERIATSSKRNPPTTYNELKRMVGSNAALLGVLFGKSAILSKRCLRYTKC